MHAFPERFRLRPRQVEAVPSLFSSQYRMGAGGSTLFPGTVQRCSSLRGANPSSDLVFGALILGQAKGCQPSITLSAIGRALLALVVLVLAEHVGSTETW